MNPKLYEVIQATEKRNNYRIYRYTKLTFGFDFKILLQLYRAAKRNHSDPNIEIYFRIKFFKQLEKFPCINFRAYVNLHDGMDLAVSDVCDFAITHFLK